MADTNTTSQLFVLCCQAIALVNKSNNVHHQLMLIVAYYARKKRNARCNRITNLRPRTRRTVQHIYQIMGPENFKRMYRMSYASFWKLLRLLKPHMNISKNESSPAMKRTPNGVIPPSIRLSAALRYFAGGRQYDIAALHEIGLSSVLERCVWIVLDAINTCPQLQISYPTKHEEQKQIADGFRKKSQIGTDICAGAIDGILIWTESPNEKDCLEMMKGEKAFFCGRKHKFGLNMQAVCDSNGKFLEVWIKFPGASSDYIAFTSSKFYERLMTEGFLDDKLAIFGDNAYVCTNKLISPYKMARSGPHDDFNFFHSQLRINIECAFGMLVHRWSILRTALSASMRMKRQIALTMALCKLHNFCLSMREPRPSPRTRGLMFRQIMSNACELDEQGIPFGLTNAGHHCNDVIDRPITRSTKRAGLLKMVVDSGMHRVVVNTPRRRMSNYE